MVPLFVPPANAHLTNIGDVAPAAIHALCSLDPLAPVQAHWRKSGVRAGEGRQNVPLSFERSIWQGQELTTEPLARFPLERNRLSDKKSRQINRLGRILIAKVCQLLRNSF